jgi:GT2 family glycosyltransferase
MGRRVDLAPEVSLWLRNHFDKFLSAEFFLRAVTSENSNRGIRISNEFAARTLGAFRVPSLLGSNFSIDRELLEKINGFDESNTHYWGEDGDLFARCVHVGAEIIGRKMFAVQYHLWHERRHPKPDAYQQYLNRLNDASYVYCEQGLKDSVTSVLK